MAGTAIPQYTSQTKGADFSILLQLAKLDKSHYDNFNSIVYKYPNLSKDLVMSMVSSGLNANTPGIEKITSLDGIGQLKADSAKIGSINSAVKQNKGIFGSIENAYNKYVYGTAKTATRTAFAALRLPYDAATVMGRDFYAMAKGETPVNAFTPLKDIFGKSTQLGSLVSGALTGQGTGGNGFFVTPESKVGKMQADAMAAYGNIDHKSFTLGRFAALELKAHPGSVLYNVTSGLVDATLNIAFDPSTYIGVKEATAILRGSKYIPGLVASAKKITTPIEELRGAAKAAADKEQLKAVKRLDKRFLADEQALHDAQIASTEAETLVASKFLKAQSDRVASLQGSAEAKDVLSDENLVHYVTTHPKTTTGELTDAINQLSADGKSLSWIFGDAIHMDTLPGKNQISVGTNGMDEYFVTSVAKKKPVIVDMADTFMNATVKERGAELERRAKLMDSISEIALREDLPESTKTVANKMADYLLQSTQNLSGPVGSLMFGKGEFTLANLINESANAMDPLFSHLVVEEIQKIYKADIYSNYRALNGKTGGFAVVNGKIIASKKAEITNAISNFKDSTQIQNAAKKLIDTVEAPEVTLAAAKAKLAETTAKKAELTDRLNQIQAFRDAVEKDPEVLNKIINDPEYMGISHLTKLPTKIAKSEEAYLRELARNDVGLISELGGPLVNDANKVLKYMLGARFNQIAEIVSTHHDPVLIHKLFGKKLDAGMVNELAKADTVDKVKYVFIRHMGMDMDPTIYRSLSLKLQSNLIDARPIVKLVEPVSLQALRTVELTEKVFGRMYVRSAIHNLGDVTGLVNGVENWATSVSKLKSSKTIGRKDLDKLVEDTQRQLFATESKQARGVIVENMSIKLQEMIASNLGIKDKETLDALAKVLKINGKDKVGSDAQYSVNEIAFHNAITYMKHNGEEINLTKGLHPWQVIEDTVRLPDTRQIEKFLMDYKANLSIYGKIKAQEVLIQSATDFWRTAQLAFRVSYILRNVGEMQIRQYLSGHSTIFNHPLEFISMVVANPDGGRIGKMFAKSAKYQYDAYGRPIKGLAKSLEDPEVNKSELEALQQMQRWMYRDQSASDFRKGPRGEVTKEYSVTFPGKEDYYMGLAFTLMRHATDALDSSIATLVFNNASDKEKYEHVLNLVNTFDKKGNILKDYVSGVFKKSNNLQKIFLKDVEKGAVADNLNVDEIYRYFYDTNQPHSIASELLATVGTGPKSQHIKDLIASGSTVVKDSRGKETRITIPWLDGVVSEADLAKREERLKVLLSRHLKPEDIKGSRVLVSHDKLQRTSTSVLDDKVSWFFRQATKIENVVNFGPEYQQVYWDYIGRYAGMLSTKELARVRENANKALAGLKYTRKKMVNGKEVEVSTAIGRKHPILNVLDKELKKRAESGYIENPTASLNTINSLAADRAGKYVQGLFYDAHNQRQIANSWRLVFPFAQAQFNTLAEWSKLATQNPVKVYRFGKAFNALTQSGSSTIYDVTGIKHDANQGFFYTDPGKKEKKFTYPLAGSVLGALAGGGISGKDALQLTAPVSSLNVATGQVNPLLPGFGPGGQFLYTASGASKMFGPGWDSIRSMVQPFGDVKNPYKVIVPAWLNKSFLYLMGDQATVQSGVKDWASYLASTGKYGDNALMDPTSRNQLFQEAEKMSKWVGVTQALFQSIAPGTPSQQVLSAVKGADNKVYFTTQTLLYKAYDDLKKRFPGENNKATYEFANTFGINNLMITMGATSRGVPSATKDAWNFLNNNPSAANTYALGGPDIVPYFFPGGDFSSAYYSFQNSKGARSQLNTEQLKAEGANLVYKMLQSQIVQKQIDNGYSQDWYNAQMTDLDKQFGGAKPQETVTTGSAAERIARVGKALQDPIFKDSPVYDATNEFYSKYNQFKSYLNSVGGVRNARFTGKSWQVTTMREQLVDLADRLMQENPAFSRMYYGVFYTELKVK